MAAQSAKLRVGQIGVGTFGVAAVAQAHELGIGIDAGGDAYLGNTLPKVIFLPGQEGFTSAIRLIAHHYQISVPQRAALSRRVISSGQRTVPSSSYSGISN